VVTDGQLVGIITETDLLDFLIELLAGELVPA
jgi:CBS domain-containing protein